MPELKIPVVIELLGHKATITYIGTRLKDDIWYLEDMISFQFEFEEAVGGTLGFGIYLLARVCRSCTPAELLALVTVEGEKRLKQIIERDKAEKEKRETQEVKQRDLDSVAQDIVNRLTGEG